MLVNVFLKNVKLLFLNQIIFFLLLVFIFTQICPSNIQQYLDYNDSRMCLKKPTTLPGTILNKELSLFFSYSKNIIIGFKIPKKTEYILYVLDFFILYN